MTLLRNLASVGVVVAAFFVYGPAGLLVAGAICLCFEFSMRAVNGRRGHTAR